MHRLRILCLFLLALPLLAACGAETPTPTQVAPTNPPPTATAVPATATQPEPSATMQDSTPTTAAATATVPAATATLPAATATTAAAAQPTATVGLVPGGWVWIEQQPGGPSPRYDHTAVLDPVRDQLVVFGGRNEEVLGDTWIFDFASASWREVTAEGPVARFGHGAVYDRANDRVMMVMGQAGSQFFNDVWAFDLRNETWSLLKPHHIADNEPRPRYGQSAALDKQGRVLISHGFSDQGRFDDTWAFEPEIQQWIDISAAPENRPLKRCLHELAYDPNGDRLIMYGGCSSGFGPCPQGDMWSFDLASRTWTEIKPEGEIPSPRSNPSFALNPLSGEIMMFGGLTENGPYADNWRYTLAANSWSPFESEISPSARSSQATAGDPEGRRVVIFGGKTRDGAVNDLWYVGY